MRANTEEIAKAAQAASESADEADQWLRTALGRVAVAVVVLLVLLPAANEPAVQQFADRIVLSAMLVPMADAVAMIVSDHG